MILREGDGPKVRMHIVRFITMSKHSGRRGSPAIPAGTELFAIMYDRGGYFTYSYQRREDAQSCIDMMVEQGTDRERYYHFNVVQDIQRTMHVSPRMPPVVIIEGVTTDDFNGMVNGDDE